MPLTDDDESFLKGINETMASASATKDLQRAVSAETTKVSHKGKLSQNDVDRIAKDFFQDSMEDLNNWDRRRILMRLEKLYRSRR